MSSAMVYGLRTCLRCPQIARRCFSSQSRRLEEQGTEKDFQPKKALLVRKVTRYEYEKFYLKPELSEAQLQEYVRNCCSFVALLLLTIIVHLTGVRNNQEELSILLGCFVHLATG